MMTIRLTVFMLILFLSLFGARLLMAEGFAQASRPIEEMRGNCDHYALDVRKELAAMEGVPRNLTALTERGADPPISPSRQALLVTLLHRESVTLVATPKPEGPNAGLLALSVPEDGLYRISAGSVVWIEIVHGQARVEPTQFEMQTGCAALFKTIQYRLKKDVGYWLELSGNMPTATIILSPETR
jgi:hypothetical protein